MLVLHVTYSLFGMVLVDLLLWLVACLYLIVMLIAFRDVWVG